MFRVRITPLILLGVFAGALLAWAEDEKPEYSAEERGFWSFQPPRFVAPPPPRDDVDRRWVRNPIDAFVLAKLRTEGLAPAPEADRATLARRLYFDLTGLPPTPRQVAEFLADRSPDAYDRLVDRLLGSPAYGQRWAQHWLDVIRFAETEGFEYDRYRPDAWRFRDFVVDAFNEDRPFDEFARQQLAGDEMESADPAQRRIEQIASGFHRGGPIRRNAGNPEVAFSRNEVLTEMTDIIGSSFLGMTLGCARCHDHMFDPIRQADYYRFQAHMAATHETNIDLADPATRKQWEERTKQITDSLTKLRAKLSKAADGEKAELRSKVAELESTLPEPLPAIAAVSNDDKRRTPIHVLERGDEALKGAVARPRTLGVLLPEKSECLPSDSLRPKTRLADWLLSRDNPLTGRVLVNRLWAYHFGTGIVATTNDFGANGDRPSHPELLDYLALTLLDDDWRVKRLQRLMVTSSAYRQSSRSPLHRSAAKVDPDNRWLWRFRRRRLEAEQLRDAILSVAGELNQKAAGRSVIPPVDQELVDLLYKPSQWKVSPDPADHNRRSIYLIAKRNLRLPFLEVFDQPDLQCTCGRRESSTHAPQVLELLNGEWTNRMAASLADRLRRECGTDRKRIVRRAFQLIAGRDPNARERSISLEFLNQRSLREFALAALNLNAFLYVD